MALDDVGDFRIDTVFEDSLTARPAARGIHNTTEQLADIGVGLLRQGMDALERPGDLGHLRYVPLTAGLTRGSRVESAGHRAMSTGTWQKP